MRGLPWSSLEVSSYRWRGLGVLYLYVKTIERAHTPAKMWEKIPLSKNYSKALEQVSQPSTCQARHHTADNITPDRQGAHVLAEFHDPQM